MPHATGWTLAIAAMLAAMPVAQGMEATPVDAEDVKVMSSEAFLRAHPDMKHRSEGWKAYTDADFELARTHFLKAAAYGDKPSQGMLAEMAWKGQGQPEDRPTAYAWADIAAERGYRHFVAQREFYWRELSEHEQARALELGQPLLAEYRDDVARPRLARHLRRARFHMIGGRPRRDATVVVPGPDGLPMRIRGHDFYAEKFWQPAAYQAWVDQVWTDPPEQNVDVGDPERVKDGR